MASSSLDGLRGEGPGTAVAVRKLRRRSQNLPNIFLGMPRQTRPQREPGPERWGMMGRTVTGVKVQGGHLGQRSWGQGGSWNRGDMESQGCVAMESHISGQREEGITHCLYASNKLHGKRELWGHREVVDH